MVIFHSYVSLPYRRVKPGLWVSDAARNNMFSSRVGVPTWHEKWRMFFCSWKWDGVPCENVGLPIKKMAVNRIPDHCHWQGPMEVYMNNSCYMYIHSYIATPTKKDRWKKCDDFSRFRTLLLFYLLTGYPCRCTKTSMASHPWRLNSLMCSMLGMFFFQKKNGGIKIYKNQILKSTSIASKWSQSHSMCNNASPSLAKPTLR